MHETEEQREYLSAIYRSSTFHVGWLMEEHHGVDVIALHGEPEPYEGQDRIVKYLRYGGMPCIWRMSDSRDGWAWDTQDVCLFRYYNLALAPDFVETVMSR